MERNLFPRLVMIGPRDARHPVSGTIEAYRAQGLFRRWATEYHAPGPRALQQLAATLVRHGRVVLHVHVGSRADLVASAPAMALGLVARCPLLLHLHGGDLRPLYEKGSAPTRAALRYFLERAAGVLVPCESMRTWVHGLARRAEVASLPPPVALEDIERPAERHNVVLFLGRLEAEKGVFDLMDAVATLRAEVPDVRLVCAGEGRRRALARYARHLGLAEQVRLTGWVGPSGKRALFESAAVYARPSYEDGLPLSLLEAMGAGVPAVASGVGGIPEVVVDGVTGFLTAPGDTASLARLLRRMLKQPLAAARIGKAGRESVRLRFGAERMVARLEEVYSSIGLIGAAGEAAAQASGMREAL